MHICIFIGSEPPIPERPSKDWHEPLLEAPAKTHSVDKAASAGIKRITACRHYQQDAAFAERRDMALKRQTAFLRCPPHVRQYHRGRPLCRRLAAYAA